MTSPNMDVIKHHWINELAKYDFSFKYQKGKNNTVADAPSWTSKKCLSKEEMEVILQSVPIIPGEDTVIEVFEEEEEDRRLEQAI